MKTKDISRRQFFKFSGTALAGSLLSTGLGSVVFAQTASRDFGAIKFGVISDAHLDIRGKNGMKMSAESVNSVKKTVDGLNLEEDLSFVLVAGDLLLDGEKENATQIKALLDTLEYPYFVIAGNHDYMPADPTKRRENFSYLTINDFVKSFKGHGYDKSMKRYYAQQIKPGLRIIGLDACLPEDPKKWGGVLPKEQITWLDKQLTDHKEDLNLIMIHHNLIQWTADELAGGPKQWFAIDNAQEVRDLLAKHSKAAPVVISGHRHIGLNYKELSGVNYFVMPSINSHPMRYTLFELNHKAISWKTPMVGLPVKVHMEAKENLLNAEWWRATQYNKRNSFTDNQVLSLYENSSMVLGEKEII